MTDPWRYFWFTLGVMAAAAVVLACIERSSSTITLGSLADWFAGAATAAAVVVALVVANRQGALALQVAEDDRAARRREAHDADIRVLKAMLLVLSNGYAALDDLKRYDDETGGPDARAAIEVFRQQLDAVTLKLLDDVRIEQLPTTSAVDLLMAARATWPALANQVYAAEGDVFPAMSLNVLDLSFLDRILDALSREIVMLGGGVSGVEDAFVRRRLERAASWTQGSSQAR